MSVAIDVVIVSYRCADLLRECLGSLEGLPERESMTVYVIDNASADGTAGVVRAEHPGVHLVENATNRGFAAACNQGIRAGAAPLVLILNPDAALSPETLAPLLERLAAEPRVAAVGPMLMRPDGTVDHAAKRSFPTIRGALSYFTGLDRRAPGRAQYTAPEVAHGPVDAINGAFMLVRREALDEVGLFDEGYWMYMEDLDLCYRLGSAGWTVSYEPRSVATHLKGGSSGAVRSARLNAWFHYGMLRFYRKFYAPDRAWAVNAAVYAGIALKLAVSTVRGWAARLFGAAKPPPAAGPAQ